jgi:hypothetical protein
MSSGNPIPGLDGLGCAVHGIFSAYLGQGLVEGVVIGLLIALFAAFVGLKFKLRWVFLLIVVIVGLILYSNVSALGEITRGCGFPIG